MKKIDEQIEQLVIQLYQSGLSFAKIEKECGVNQTTAFNIIKRHGIQIRTKGGINKLNINDIVEKYKQGIRVVEIAKQYNVRERTIYNYLEKAEVPRDAIYYNKELNRNYFQDIDSYDKAYFLGFMATDGNVGKNSNSVSITLSEKDSYILEVFREKIGNENPLYVLERNGRKNKEVTFHLKSEKIKNDLSKYGVIPNKTFSIGPPFDINNDLMSHFIRGLIDGDGFISYKSHQIGFCGNEKMVTFVRDYLCDLLGVYKVKVIKAQEHLWQITWASKKDIKKIGEYIYNNKCECYLHRKYDNYINIIS